MSPDLLAIKHVWDMLGDECVIVMGLRPRCRRCMKDGKDSFKSELEDLSRNECLANRSVITHSWFRTRKFQIEPLSTFYCHTSLPVVCVPNLFIISTQLLIQHKLFRECPLLLEEYYLTALVIIGNYTYISTLHNFPLTIKWCMYFIVKCNYSKETSSVIYVKALLRHLNNMYEKLLPTVVQTQFMHGVGPWQKISHNVEVIVPWQQHAWINVYNFPMYMYHIEYSLQLC